MNFRADAREMSVILENSLLQSLFDEGERKPWTVTKLNEEVRSALESRFSNVWVEAEIVDFKEPTSGHWYFTLRDSQSQVKAACFRGTNWKIRFRPYDGLQVRVRGKLSVYEPRGEYQILVSSLEPFGEGALRVAFEQIKAKLQEEGLFAEEYKRRLPALPRRVGVVTSPTGAAIHDILNVITRRTRTVDVVLIPAAVQGEGAPESIRAGILLAQDYNARVPPADSLDVLIVGRGGGSAEDLAAFNEERLARTIFESEIPVISAVGHEIDFSISDFVADLRAPTPSAAAELVAESEDNLSRRILTFRERAADLLELRLSSASRRLQSLTDSAVFQLVPRRLERLREHVTALDSKAVQQANRRLQDLGERLAVARHRLAPVRLSGALGEKKLQLGLLEQKNRAAAVELLRGLREDLKMSMTGLNALSPLAVLDRGYSITMTEDGKIVRDSSGVEIGESLKISLARGKLKTEVTSKE